MKVALISLDQAWENKARNLTRCRELTAQAAQVGAEVVIFPEMTLTGFTMNTEVSAEPSEESASCRAFSALAREHRVSVISGVVLRTETKAANTLFVFSPVGREEARYAKIHPFTHGGEDTRFSAGRTLVTTPLGEFSAGLTICYDLRFPELYTALGKSCDLLINIANWPERRLTHWLTLLQARAIENQCFVIGVNRTGVDGKGLKYAPSSGVVTANGEFLVPFFRAGEIECFELNRGDLRDLRAAFSTRQDRRPELYREFL